MEREQVPLNLPSLRLPLKQAGPSLRLCIHIDGDLVEVLQQQNDEERHLVVGELSNRIEWKRLVCEIDKKLDKSHTC